MPYIRNHIEGWTDEPELLVMVESCQKTADRRDACRETWMSHPWPKGVKVIFVVGRPGEPEALAGDTLYLNCQDSYVALPQKTWCGIRECLARWDFKWLFKTDDDTFCHLQRLAAYPKTNDYIGREVARMGPDPEWHRTVVPRKELTGKFDYQSVEEMVRNGVWNGPWASGGGYFLSRRAAMMVAQEPYSHVLRELYEDKMVGDIMASHGIYLHGRHVTLRLSKNEGIYGATFIHPCDPARMRDVYHKLFRAGEMQT